MIDEGEDCDGTALGGEACWTIGGSFNGGLLACAADCRYDWTGCTPRCGNGVTEALESCDGDDLRGTTCGDLGFDFGTLECAPDCTSLDSSACRMNVCGDGVLFGGEECDGADVGGAACTDLGAFTGGTLGCTVACDYDLGACAPNVCGDGVALESEDCDGADVLGATCADLGPWAGGTPACSGGCTYDTSVCVPFPCGDGTRNGFEDCDGADLDGASCLTLGFAAGALACSTGCTLDDAGCLAECEGAPALACGDVIVADALLGGASAFDWGCLGGGYGGPEVVYSVTPPMSGWMTVDVEVLDPDMDVLVLESAGDGCDVGSCTTARASVLNGLAPEQVRFWAIGGATYWIVVDSFTALGAPGGAFELGVTCEACGDGVVAGAEACDDGNASGGDGCSAACALEAPVCGNGLAQAGEVCDGADLVGATCASLGRGFTGGALACELACGDYDDAACAPPAGCGDGVPAAGEACDGADLGGATCASLGFTGGTLDCFGGCTFDARACYVPSVPAPRRPMHDAYVGSIFVADSMRPDFAWDASTVAGAEPIDYELQYDTDPAFPAPVTIATTTTNAQPAADLPVSLTAPVGDRYYWRVRACAAGACSAYSPVRRVNLGRSDRDLNGDGYADLAIGAPQANPPGVTQGGRVYVYFGGAGPVDTTADVTLNGTFAYGYRGISVDYAGDVNGDGFGDLVVGEDNAPGVVGSPSAGRAYVYLGGSPFDAVADGSMMGAGGYDYFGFPVAGAGDVDGDGFADVLVGAFGSDVGALEAGRAYLFLGGPGAAFDATADQAMTGPAGYDDYAYSLDGAGDVDGDGYADLIVGARLDDTGGTDAGRAYVYLGGPGGYDDTPIVTYTGTAIDELGRSVAGGGDVNGDGYADVLVGYWLDDPAGTNSGSAAIYFGGPGGPSASPAGTMNGAAAFDLFGLVSGPGDVDGDGYHDVLVTAIWNDASGTNAGRAYLYLGGPGATFDAVADVTFGGAVANGEFGLGLGGCGDLNGDGAGDLAVGAWTADVGWTDTGAAYVFLGTAGAVPDTVADASFTGAGAAYLYGFGVAGR